MNVSFFPPYLFLGLKEISCGYPSSYTTSPSSSSLKWASIINNRLHWCLGPYLSLHLKHKPFSRLSFNSVGVNLLMGSIDWRTSYRLSSGLTSDGLLFQMAHTSCRLSNGLTSDGLLFQMAHTSCRLSSGLTSDGLLFLMALFRASYSRARLLADFRVRGFPAITSDLITSSKPLIK
jgi:hypothetical protein